MANRFGLSSSKDLLEWKMEEQVFPISSFWEYVSSA